MWLVLSPWMINDTLFLVAQWENENACHSTCLSFDNSQPWQQSVHDRTRKTTQGLVSRHEANADTNVSVVKITLKSFCTEQANTLLWESVLKDMGKMVTEAYGLANIHVKRNGKLDDQAHLLLPLTYVFLSDIEEWNRRNQATPEFKEIHSFSVLPFKKDFECSHFTMCNLGLRALLKRAGIDVLDENVWIPEADTWWRNLFNVKKFETTNRKFVGMVLTDGKAVSIVVRKPKR
ncbi:hypothetical protein BBJ29_004866 [Phytophthora kernoviae]|uniref:Uncharacterized protein n=1 Tax=Phytophthora kernoviae TaxID=325452 RepID=A0A3F2S3I4_9STRA|nr:hypothetical protein BBJ29_004866 [Phytophthora kernoviae]RLN69593.1 hypothetical protein BBP00_00000278 [Phytophthora kernoviae]